MGDIMEKENLEKKVKVLIDKIRPFLVNDGGDVEFIKIEDGYVYVKLLGACHNCHMAEFTLKEGIEAIIVEELPDIKGVINV